MRINLLLFLLLSASTLAAQPLRTGKDYAVFFVASKFDNGWKSLPDAPSEVNLLAADLRDDYAFDVRIIADARRADILRTLSEYKGKKYGQDDQLLLFFSMHGYHDAGSDKGYLIPKDGLYNDPIYETWLAHSQLAEIAASIPCRRVLVSLDACYSGIFSSSRDKPGAAPWETGDDCQARVKAAFAGRDQTRKYVAAGGDQRVPAKSDFADQWHSAFQQGYGEDGLLSFAELAATLDQFRDPRPVWGDFVRSTFGDFVFVRNNGCATPAPPTGGGPADQDKSQWRQAQSANTLASYRQYLRDCNLCLYTEEAEAAISRLKATAPSTETRKTAENMPDNMVFVKGGPFTMGCKDGRDEDCAGNEKPAHIVTLNDFYIGKYEVTQAEWVKVMGNNPSYFKNCDDCPVHNIEYEDIQIFLKKINSSLNNGVKKYRLPTEAEWEYAARGGNQSKNYKYSGSNELDEVAWFHIDSDFPVHPVGQKKPNELGIYDMSGNLFEWCEDWFDDNYYKNSKIKNPKGPKKQITIHSMRGGSWFTVAIYCRTSNRGWANPGTQGGIGFRLVRSY